ncbi:MAG: fatty acid--CoA ligase family protein, partial [Alphaproteobacteria bacterium]|nr:fatty acid--CoA ligase family protein [Alphaproteobacteria bacterium]
RLSLCDDDLMHEVAEASDRARRGGSGLTGSGPADSSPPPWREEIGIAPERSGANAADTSPAREGLRAARIDRPLLGPCLALGRWDAPDPGTWFAAVAGCDACGARMPQTTAGHDGVIFFTSGTTDRPKGVVLSYREQIGNVTPMAAAFGISAADRIYDFRSFNWASAQLFGVLGALSCAATLVMRRNFSVTRFFDDIRTHGVTVAAGNPTTISMLLGAGHTIRAGDVPALRFMTSSSAPLSEREWRRFEDHFGIPVAQSYGSSETAWISINPGRDRRFGTVGRPLAYQELAIVDDTGRKLAPGEIGEIEVGGWQDNQYRYIDDNGAVRVNSRGRMRTGDIGYLDADGFLHLTGRQKDLIIRGGVNISPAEIDGVLMQRAEVAEAATVGVPDAVWGEEVVSYVTLRPGEPFVPDELMGHCAAQLPHFKAPKQIFLREALPRSERGKLDRRALVLQWVQQRNAP